MAWIIVLAAAAAALQGPPAREGPRLAHQPPTCDNQTTYHLSGVCNDPDLLALDIQVREAMRRLLAQRTARGLPVDGEIETHNQWFDAVAFCEGEAGCARRVYVKRLTDLEAQVAAASDGK